MHYFQASVTSSSIGPDIILCILISNTLGLGSFHNVRDRVSLGTKWQKKLWLVYLNWVFQFKIAGQKAKTSEKSCSKHSLNVICSCYLLLSFPHIQTLPQFPTIYCLFLCCDFALHSGNETWTSLGFTSTPIFWLVSNTTSMFFFMVLIYCSVNYHPEHGLEADIAHSFQIHPGSFNFCNIMF